MSRRLVITILVVLIVGVVGGTAALVASRLQRGEEAGPTDTEIGDLSQSETGSQRVVDPTGDDDGDGLSNSDERLWGTNAELADTDGDGFSDGQEVAANHNPTIPAPNDVLPPGFQPGRELNPLEEAGSGPVAVDQFFEENLNLTIAPGRNLTEEYDRQVPDEQKTPVSLVTFARQQPIITKLPAVRGEVIRQTESSRLNLTAYTSGVGSLDALANPAALNSAVQELVQNRNPSQIRGLAASVRLYQESLLQLPVPPEAIALHKLLLGYTELLASTFDQIGLWEEDAVKALTALNQLDQIDRQYFPLIRAELARLQ